MILAILLKTKPKPEPFLWGNTIEQYLTFLAFVGGGIIVGRLLYFVLKKYVRRITSNTRTDIDDIIIDMIEEPLVALVVIVGFYFGNRALTMGEVLKNIFGGITIITDRPFKLGDYVEINNFQGVIEEIGLRSIRLKTFEGFIVTIPNHLITETSVKNFNRYKVTRLIFTIGLTYGMTDRQIITAKRLVEEALDKTKRVIKGTHEIEFVNFNDFSLDLYIACDVACNIPPLRRKVQDSINMKIKQAFDKEGIEMAFPTQTIEWKRAGS